MELKILEYLSKQEKPVFVDTNVSIETLKNIAVHDHVMIMLEDPQISVRGSLKGQTERSNFCID